MVRTTIPREPGKSNRERYARLSKNLNAYGDLAGAGREVGLTGRDIHMFVVLLAEAQRQRNRRVEYSSLYEILALAGWRKRGREYRDASVALCRWEEIEVTLGKFFNTKLPKRVKDRHTEKKITNFIRFKEGPGRKVTITFGKMFWNTCLPDAGYFCRAWPDLVKRLRYPPEIFLYLLLDAHGHKIEWKLETVAQRMSLRPRSRPWMEERIGKALQRIIDETGKDYEAEMNPNGVIKIVRTDVHDEIEAAIARKAKQQDRDDWHYMQGQYNQSHR
jgi:hypothetical protein